MSYQTRRAERIAKIVSEVCERIDKDILFETPKPGLKMGIEDLAKVTNPAALRKVAAKTDINIVPGKLTEAPLAEALTDVSKDIVIQGKKVYIPTDIADKREQVEFTTPKGLTYTAIVGSMSGKVNGESLSILDNIKRKKEENVPTKTIPTDSDVPTNNVPEDKEEKVADTQQENAVYNLKNWATQLQIPIGEGEPSQNGSLKFTYFSEGQNNPIIILVLSNGLIKMSGHQIADFSDFENIINWHKSNT